MMATMVPGQDGRAAGFDCTDEPCGFRIGSRHGFFEKRRNAGFQAVKGSGDMEIIGIGDYHRVHSAGCQQCAVTSEMRDVPHLRQLTTGGIGYGNKLGTRLSADGFCMFAPHRAPADDPDSEGRFSDCGFCHCGTFQVDGRYFGRAATTSISTRMSKRSDPTVVRTGKGVGKNST
jgi:hypothetical protein